MSAYSCMRYAISNDAAASSVPMAHEKLITHYDNLKVARNAPPEVIRAAYRVLAQQFHPDKYPDRVLAEHRMKIINAAYEVLSDPIRRREHDAWIDQQERSSKGEEKTGRSREMGKSGSTIYSEKSQSHDARKSPHEAGTEMYRDHLSKSYGRKTGWEVVIALALSPFRLLNALCNLRIKESTGFVFIVILLVLGFIYGRSEHLESGFERKAIESPANRAAPAFFSASQKPPFEEAARCFWIYAPLVQVGRDYPHEELYRFGQSRMVWYDQFLKANKANPNLKDVFENGIVQYKRAGMNRVETLRASLSSNNQRSFASMVEAATSCDKVLGIRTEFTPRM